MGKKARIRKERITPQQRRQQLQGGEYLGPGVWVDRHGGLHFSVPELLAYFNVEDTPENRDECQRVIAESLAKQCPEATIIEQDETTDG